MHAGTAITDDSVGICVESQRLILDSLVDVQYDAVDVDMELFILSTLIPWAFHSPSEAKKTKLE